MGVVIKNIQRKVNQVSKSTTPTYRATVTQKNGFRFSVIWDCRYAGRPTDASALNWLNVYNASLAPGGVNAHLAGNGHEAVSIKVEWNNRYPDPVATASL